MSYLNGTIDDLINEQTELGHNAQTASLIASLGTLMFMLGVAMVFIGQGAPEQRQTPLPPAQQYGSVPPPPPLPRQQYQQPLPQQQYQQPPPY